MMDMIMMMALKIRCLLVWWASPNAGSILMVSNSAVKVIHCLVSGQTVVLNSTPSWVELLIISCWVKTELSQAWEEAAHTGHTWPRRKTLES